ncbi:arsenite efflux transporter metallochaperone ArsD [Halalkalibacter sp. APA_J-10(15)]|uniref:arsenite efflux transporter metallochaperone ArsD n=1 Tax=Halalkalibacter sp. APA_J-10(15) TaxID=2933805 RepID=UPI001FF25633|nr:arsenite efflux transporter metallochaperone ArsD [Halalkalibacter sp. APA_J-10(15)]MCK0473472.1 arsenite efflux transporter metallochaperone ArsD [Halalkalibacter sp. APA_J-10(15)]
MKLEIFDPAMCCSTGVCGPSLDPELTRVASAVYSLEKKGYQVKRYQLTNDADQFVSNQEVNRLLNERGPDSLPIVLVDGQVEKIGEYPSNEELAEWFHLREDDLKEKPKVRLPIDVTPLN